MKKQIFALILASFITMNITPEIDSSWIPITRICPPDTIFYHSYIYYASVQNKSVDLSHHIFNNDDLPNIIDQLIPYADSITGLDLSNNENLTTLPENLKKLTSLETLNLTNTSVKKRPSILFRLKNIKTIIMYSGEILDFRNQLYSTDKRSIQTLVTFWAKQLWSSA